MAIQRENGFMLTVSRQLVSTCLVVTLLCACQSPPPQPIKKSAPAPVAKRIVPTPKPVLTREQNIRQLLADADSALANNQLLMPLDDNAHDRYHAVLLLDPENTQAKTGLQAITLRYLDLARDATAHSQYAQAQGYLNNARDIDPANPLLNEFATVLRKEIARQKPAPVYKPGPNEHMINVQELSRKSETVIAYLGQLAQKAKESGDLVMIYARNDAEGRWIYQQMRNALPGFLLRGDIKIAQQPRIQFVPRL